MEENRAHQHFRSLMSSWLSGLFEARLGAHPQERPGQVHLLGSPSHVSLLPGCGELSTFACTVLLWHLISALGLLTWTKTVSQNKTLL